MIGLRAQRIDFAAHFLRDEAQFLSVRIGIFERLEKIAAVASEAHLLFGDVQLIDIEDELLFEAVHIYLLFAQASSRYWPMRSRMRGDRKSVVKGKGGSVRVDHGGRRIIKK